MSGVPRWSCRDCRVLSDASLRVERDGELADRRILSFPHTLAQWESVQPPGPDASPISAHNQLLIKPQGYQLRFSALFSSFTGCFRNICFAHDLIKASQASLVFICYKYSSFALSLSPTHTQLIEDKMALSFHSVPSLSALFSLSRSTLVHMSLWECNMINLLKVHRRNCFPQNCVTPGNIHPNNNISFPVPTRWTLKSENCPHGLSREAF